MTGTPLQAKRIHLRQRYVRRRKRLDALGHTHTVPTLSQMTTRQFARFVRDLKRLDRQPIIDAGKAYLRTKGLL